MRKELAPDELKGFGELSSVWCVTGERSLTNRFDVRKEVGLTPCFGRGPALAVLVNRWRRANTVSGQVVLIRGEAGIGKSRIVEELAGHLSAEPHSRIDYAGSPFHESSPLHPVIAQLEGALGLARADAPSVKRAKLDTYLDRQVDRTELEAAEIASVLSIPAAARDVELDTDAPRRKRLILQTLAERIVALTTRQPTLIVCEDVHWLFQPRSRGGARSVVADWADLMQGSEAMQSAIGISCRDRILTALETLRSGRGSRGRSELD